jgi:putative hydrolase of the HAD superfamily
MHRLTIDGEPVETFLFDMDGTLFGYDDVVASINSEYRVLREVQARSGCDQPISTLNTMLQAAFDVDRRTWFSRLLENLGCGDPDERTSLAADLEHLYWLTFGKFNVPYDDGVHFIEQLVPHVRIGMITDGYRFNQKSKLYSSGLNRFFDLSAVVFSDDVGVMKPDVRIFEHALEKFGAKAETTVYIGDKIAKDVRGANAAGIRSILLRRGRNAFEPVGDGERDRPDIEVRSFYDLLDHCAFVSQASAA